MNAPGSSLENAWGEYDSAVVRYEQAPARWTWDAVIQRRNRLEEMLTAHRPTPAPVDEEDELPPIGEAQHLCRNCRRPTEMERRGAFLLWTCAPCKMLWHSPALAASGAAATGGVCADCDCSPCACLTDRDEPSEYAKPGAEESRKEGSGLREGLGRAWNLLADAMHLLDALSSDEKSKARVHAAIEEAHGIVQKTLAREGKDLDGSAKRVTEPQAAPIREAVVGLLGGEQKAFMSLHEKVDRAYSRGRMQGYRDVLDRLETSASESVSASEPSPSSILDISGQADRDKQINRQLSQQADRLAAPVPPPQAPDIEAKYNELIYAVGTKHPGESRHETALRYIKRAEGYTITGIGQKSAASAPRSEA